MKSMKFLALAAIAVCLISCGDRKKSKDKDAIVLSPETTKIKGDLGDYFEVVNREYKLTDGDWGNKKMISIEIRRTDIDYAFDLDGVYPYGYSGQEITGHAGFGIEIRDTDGNVIRKIGATASGTLGMYSSEDMKEALRLKAGETATIRWQTEITSDNKPAKFNLTSAYEEVSCSAWDSESDDGSSYVNDEEDTDDSDDTTTSSNSENAKWDSALDEYEKYVDQYIVLYKKAMAGDISALASYANLLENAENLAEKLDEAEDEMTVEQLNRYMDITQKLITIAY